MHGLRIDELPCIRSVEPPNPDRGDELGREIAEVDAVPSIGRWLQWLPVCDATTGSAMNSAQRLVSPYVLRSCLRMPCDLDRTELEVDPRSTYATAQRAVASGSELRRGRQYELNRPAVT